MRRFLPLFILCHTLVAAPHNSDLQPASPEDRAKRLSQYIKKERERFQLREAQKNSLLGEVDELNATQNETRTKMEEIKAHQHELVMSSENLSLEINKQRQLLELERARMGALLRILYRLRRDGLLSFLLRGESLASTLKQGRVLYRSIRSHSKLTQRIEDRTVRLQEGDKRLAELQSEVELLLTEMLGQEQILKGILTKKQRLLRTIEKRQGPYRQAVVEHKKLTSKLKNMFSKMESDRKEDKEPKVNQLPVKGSLSAPLEVGKIIRKFGKTVHKKFKTVTLQKGLEIAAPHGTPVRAVLPGKVEYAGWIQGLGNVLIVQHEGGFYSLNGHLFRSEFNKGESVEQGETIAYVGDTGKSNKPSLYFELRERTRAVDPLRYFDSDTLNALTNGTALQAG